MKNHKYLAIITLPLLAFSSTASTVRMAGASSTIQSKYYGLPTSEPKKNKLPHTEKEYLYGYTATELKAVPRISIQGHKTPEKITQHSAWALLFSNNKTYYERGAEFAWQRLKQAVPSLTRLEFNRIIEVGTAATEQEQAVYQNTREDERKMCLDIVAAAKAGKKLNNKQLKQRLSDQENKVAKHFLDSVALLKEDLSQVTYSQLENFVLNTLRRGMSYSSVDVDSMAKLRSHQYTYSDLYEAVLCEKHLN